MKKVVLDTIVIVSAFLNPAGKPAFILQAILRHDLDIYLNTAILAEYEEVLSRSKFTGKIYKPSIQRFFDILMDLGINVLCSPSSIELPDENDRKFYDVAKASEAVLITGNKKHYPNDRLVCDPAEYLYKYTL